MAEQEDLGREWAVEDQEPETADQGDGEDLGLAVVAVVADHNMGCEEGPAQDEVAVVRLHRAG